MKYAPDILEKLLNGEVVTGKQLLESPQPYAGPIVYQRDVLFRQVTPGNFASYVKLANDGELTYTVTPSQGAGTVFDNHDIVAMPKTGTIPVLTLQLHDTPIRGYKQAFRLRIRESYARHGVPTKFYLAYVQKFGGIVSDFEHFESGKMLWRSFVDTATSRGVRISLYDTTTGQVERVGPEIADDSLWSADAARKHQVLVLERL